MLNQNELFSFSILTIKEQNIQFSFFVKFYFISDIAQKKKMQCGQEFASWHDTRKLVGFVTCISIYKNNNYSDMSILTRS